MLLCEIYISVCHVRVVLPGSSFLLKFCSVAESASTGSPCIAQHWFIEVVQVKTSETCLVGEMTHLGEDYYNSDQPLKLLFGPSEFFVILVKFYISASVFDRIERLSTEDTITCSSSNIRISGSI